MSVQPTNLRKKLKFVDPAEFTPQFSWKHSARDPRLEHVFCEDVDLVAAAASFGTPTYVYSRAAITKAYCELNKD